MNINDRINKIDKFFKDLNSNEIVELIKKNGYSNENLSLRSEIKSKKGFYMITENNISGAKENEI